MAHPVLWTPDAGRLEGHPMTRFAHRFAEATGRTFDEYGDLHRASVEEREAFWSLVWDETGIIGDKGDAVLRPGETMRDDRFFPEARLNFAENLLRRTGDGDALVFRGEDRVERRMSWDDLQALVSRLARALSAAGVGEGDRVAAMMPNMPETVAVMLATASLGAIFSSCSPDFGETAVVDRFGQIEPKLLVTCDGYHYASKARETADKLPAIAERLGPERVVVVPYLGQAEAVADRIANGQTLAAFLDGVEAGPIEFRRLPFDAPLYIMFSSGTTGAPKCIVHGHGGTLIQHLKEHRLHCGIEPGDRVFYFTTCAWMMWNWLVSVLASEATALLYDGSPFHPSGEVVFAYLAAERATFFGTSAKFLDECQNRDLRPRDGHDLSRLRTVASTGSPLSPEGFSYVYEAIHPDVALASIAGGTDIISCFVLGVPWRPVRAGEIQGPGLGMAVDVWNAKGEPVTGEKGELVCTRSFPSCPIHFWGDEDGARFRSAYFETFPGIWTHGDFAEWTDTGGIVIHGRSDATLNPQGVRIGTGEIYAVVDTFDEVHEAVAVGQSWNGDERVVLFVRLGEGVALDDDLVGRLKGAIRDQASPRHVPAKILSVPDIPRTRSGKIVELAVRAAVEGGDVTNRSSLENPEALDHFRDRPELRA